jgi:hypothetical protein
MLWDGETYWFRLSIRSCRASLFCQNPFPKVGKGVAVREEKTESHRAIVLENITVLYRWFRGIFLEPYTEKFNQKGIHPQRMSQRGGQCLR